MFSMLFKGWFKSPKPEADFSWLFFPPSKWNVKINGEEKGAIFTLFYFTQRITIQDIEEMSFSQEGEWMLIGGRQ